MKILLTGEIYTPGTSLLAELGEIVSIAPRDMEAKLKEVVDADAMVVRTDPVPGEVVERGTRLKAIGRFGVGYDNIDVATATALKIPVVFAKGVNSVAVAEHTMALLLGLAKRLRFWQTHLTEGDFDVRLTTRAVDLEGKTLGIVGFGEIGRRVAQMARVFSMSIMAYDPFLDAGAVGDDVVLVGLSELFERADMVSVHVPLSDGTRGLISADVLQHAKPGLLLVNTARGPILDLDAAYEALQSGRLGGLALDVFPEEPPDVTHPVFSHPEFIGTPHVAALTDVLDRMGLVVAEEVRSVLRGERPRFLANPEIWDVRRT